MQVPKRRAEEERRARRQVDYLLTAEAVARLRRTLETLKHEHRAAADEAHRCAEMGDRSDNAAYTAAKAHLNRINGRILSLEDRLSRAVIIERGSGIGGTVRIGATVTVATADGRERTFVIVGAQEANPSRGCISHHSPVGTALLGRREGDEVQVVVGGKQLQYRIVRVQ
ncbi:MAG: transcription elongation factor GreA [bacterium]|nr:transcription elongation factor GreA [bacterium]